MVARSGGGAANLGPGLELLGKELTVDCLNSHKLGDITFTVSDNNVPIQGIDLETLLPHVDEDVATYDKVLHGLMEGHPVGGFSNALHHHPLHLGEHQVDLRPGLGIHIRILGQGSITNLELEELGVDGEECKHQLGCHHINAFGPNGLPRCSQLAPAVVPARGHNVGNTEPGTFTGRIKELSPVTGKECVTLRCSLFHILLQGQLTPANSTTAGSTTTDRETILGRCC